MREKVIIKLNVSWNYFVSATDWKITPDSFIVFLLVSLEITLSAQSIEKSTVV